MTYLIRNQTDRLDPLLLAAGTISTAVLVVPKGPFTLAAVMGVVLLPAIYFGRVAHGQRGVFWWTSSSVVAIAGVSIYHIDSFQETVFTAAYIVATGSVAILAIFVTNNNVARCARLIVAVSLGLLLGYVIQPTGVVLQQPLKSGAGVALVAVVLGLLSIYKPSAKLLPTLALFIIATVALLNDARNLAAISALTAVVLLVSSLLRPMNVTPWAKVTVLAIVSVAAAFSMTLIYENLAESGVLGADAQKRFALQSSVEGGLLLGGRPELAASLAVIKEDPLLGRGGKPYVTDVERANILKEINAGREFAISPREERRILGSGINSHSFMFGYWVKLGIVGLVSTAAIGLLLWWAAVKAVHRQMSVAALSLYAALQTSWDLLFSPWNARYEVLWGVFIALAVMVLSTNRQSASRDAAHGRLSNV